MCGDFCTGVDCYDVAAGFDVAAIRVEAGATLNPGTWNINKTFMLQIKLSFSCVEVFVLGLMVVMLLQVAMLLK